MKHIVNFSGGKDSTAMLLMMLERGMPIDDIIFVNIMATKEIGAELPEMYPYICMIEKYIGRKITRLVPEHTFEECFYTIYKKGKHVDEIYGFPYLLGAWCNSILKIRTINKYTKSLNDEFTSYIGIAVDETKRLNKNRRGNKQEHIRYPLAEWGVTEAQAKSYLEEKGLLNPLYENHKRLGCWFCGKASLNDIRIIYHDYPQYWSLLKKWQLDSTAAFRPNCSIFDLEERFKNEDLRLKQP